ncbi:MAG: DedA family protein, partial [Prevotellaceae bacterium]|nr:DedA family protein [Prevotellaceae bacterium]
MAALYDILIKYGYLGMFLVGFLAGSFIPFSSETVMTALLAAGLNPAGLVAYGSAGNIAGGMFNYWIGS